MFSEPNRCVVDACGALVTGNQIPRWPKFVELPVNVDLALQQVAQGLFTSSELGIILGTKAEQYQLTTVVLPLVHFHLHTLGQINQESNPFLYDAIYRSSSDLPGTKLSTKDSTENTILNNTKCRPEEFLCFMGDTEVCRTIFATDTCFDDAYPDPTGTRKLRRVLFSVCKIARVFAFTFHHFGARNHLPTTNTTY